MAKLPKDLARCADLLFTTRDERLALQREVDALKAKESALRQHIIDTLPKSSTGVAGKIASVAVVVKDKPTVTDWDELYGYIQENGAFELLHRRLTEGAVKEYWEEGDEVPGVGLTQYVDISLKKV